MKLNVIFLLKFLDVNNKCVSNIYEIPTKYNLQPNTLYYNFVDKNQLVLKKKFLKKSITNIKLNKLLKKGKNFNFFFLNRFLLNFLEFFFKSNFLLNLKKGTNKLILKQISSRKFYIKYFKKHLKITKQILGVIYYSLLLKDATIFVNFLRKVLEKANIKTHKKIFLGLKKLLKDIFKPLFPYLGVSGIFFNIKGKIGVSGNAKKRRYYFYYGKHSITNRRMKVDIKHTPV